MALTNIVKSVDNMGVWADKINAVMSYPCASIAAGVTTYFDDINEMFATPAADTSYIIRTGEYTLTSQLFFDYLDNVSIAAVGGPVVLNLTMPSGLNSKGATFQYCENLSVLGVTFRLQANTGNYGSGHVYTVTANSNSGIFKGCTFIMDNNLTAAEMVPTSHGISFTQTEGADRNIAIDDCAFIALPTAASNPAITQCLATHGGTLDQVPTCTNCKFIIPKSHMDSGVGDVIIANNAWLQNCLTSVYDMSTSECGLMTALAAEAYIPSDLKTYFDGYERAHSTDQGAVYAWSETATPTVDLWHTVAAVMPNVGTPYASRSPFPIFTIEIDGFMRRDGGTDTIAAKYNVRVNTLNELYAYNSGPTRMRVVWDDTAKELQVQIITDGYNAKFAGCIRLIPLVNTLFGDDTNRYAQGYLRIYETAVEVV